MFAFYVPRLLDPEAMFLFLLPVGLAVAMVYYLWERYSFCLALTFVVVGWAIATLPGLLLAIQCDLGWYGDTCREWNHVDLPDGVFSAYMYFYVDLGIVFSCLGIVVGAAALRVGGWLLELRRSRAPVEAGRD